MEPLCHCGDKRLYEQPTHVLLLSLAFSNLLLCLLVMPFGIVAGFAREFVFGNNDYIRYQFCQLSGVLLTFFVESSFHTLTLVSLDRFIYIKMAIKYYKIVTVCSYRFHMVAMPPSSHSPSLSVWGDKICLFLLISTTWRESAHQEHQLWYTIRC